MGGVGTLFLFAVIFIIPSWDTPITKGDARSETHLLIASAALPISILGGITLAGVFFVYSKYRLTHAEMFVAWLIALIVISLFRPHIDRIRISGRTPLYEWVPDILFYTSLGFAIITMIFAVAMHSKHVR